jgi:precorrin-2 dehydrogenase/sirohydrochlorin ferrochelatase
MRYYPIFVNLAHKDCLVVGAGQVGRRKIERLVECGARSVLVVDPAEPADDFAELFERPEVEYAQRSFEDADLDGKFIVIASTSSEELNWRISRLCDERSILCNIVDQPEKCSFIVPAIFNEGDLTLAVSTGGASPALAKKIRRDLNDYFGQHYAIFLAIMSRLRPMILDQGWSTSDNTEIFRRLVESDLMQALEDDDIQEVRRILADNLPPGLTGRVEEVLDGLV